MGAPIEIYFHQTGEWLWPIMILMAPEGVILKVVAHVKGHDPIEDGWYEFMGDTLSLISIRGGISFNEDKIPPK